MDFNYQKLENSKKKYIKLSNSMQNIFDLKTKDILYFAFGHSENEIINILENEYNLNINDIVSIGYGGYIEKKNVNKYVNIKKYIKGIKKEFTKDYYNCCGIYLNRLWDYESRIGFDGYENSLNDLLYYMDKKSINELDKELVKMLVLTEKYYNKEFDKIN